MQNRKRTLEEILEEDKKNFHISSKSSSKISYLPENGEEDKWGY